MPVQRTRQLFPDRIAYCGDLDLELYDRLKIPLKQKHLPAIRNRIFRMCAQDPFFYIFGGFVRTYDEHDNDHPYKPIPNSPHLHAVLEFIHSKDPVAAIAKSRQLMVSWLLMAYATWEARFHRHRKVLVQCKNADDTKEFTFGDDWLTSRAAFIEYAMPEILWLAPAPGGTVVTGKQGKLVYPSGSTIVGLPAGGDQFRSKVASLGIIDEAAFNDDFRMSYRGALAMTKGGGRLRIVSTARYGSFFGQLIQAADYQDAA